jgi:saccharopine dehydrogenase-like NADP-dependent oxidoreductase
VSQVLILGAGHSTPYLVSHLLAWAEREGGRVTVADLDPDLAARRVTDHPCGGAVKLDIEDAAGREALLRQADVVVCMLAPRYQALVASDCVRLGRHMVSTSYRDRAVRELDAEARGHGVLLVSEVGLDPGIDHMSAMALLSRIRAEGGRVRSLRSYGAGIPAPDAAPNPLRYAITWNPRNVVLAGASGAQYLEDGRIRIVPYTRVFESTWPVTVDGVGRLEAYPNRDSLAYRDAFDLGEARTIVRATLRWPGFCAIWSQIARLGLANDTVGIPDLARRTCREIVEMFVPGEESEDLESRIARLLGVEPTGPALDGMRWLGLLSSERAGCAGETAVDFLTALLVRKLALAPADRDLVILVHELEVDYPTGSRGAERRTATLVVQGELEGRTAMARTVGLPAAVVTTLILRGALSLSGSFIPTHPAIYQPVLAELDALGIRFEEKAAPL